MYFISSSYTEKELEKMKKEGYYPTLNVNVGTNQRGEKRVYQLKDALTALSKLAKISNCPNEFYVKEYDLYKNTGTCLTSLRSTIKTYHFHMMTYIDENENVVIYLFDVHNSRK